jgi:hypothetical protein
LLVLAGLLVVGLGAASPASAGVKQEFEVFKQCPLGNSAVTLCIYSTTTSGEFKLGSETVPVTKTVVLQGGLTRTSSELVPAANGETLSKTPLPVPGGLAELTLLGTLNEVNTTAELAGPVNVFIPAFGLRTGTAVSLPVKARLENPSLGETCYVGTNAEPVSLELTTGTTSPPEPNKPISGSSGTVQFAGSGKINVFKDNSLVDNSFAAPGASGCDEPLSAVVDEAVDAKTGLPSAAGNNAAILTGTLEQSSSETVKRVFALPELGRCVKAASEKVEGKLVYKGGFLDAGCTYGFPQKQGKYEWVSGAAHNHFTTSSKTISLETFSKKKILCTESTGAGEYTGTKTATLSLTLTGCENAASKEACHSESAGSGVIGIPSIGMEVGFVKDKAITGGGTEAGLGFDMKREPAFLAATCGASAEAVNATGSVIAPITSIDHTVPAYSIVAKQKTGVQAPESFEEEPKDVLHATIGSGTEQAGLGGSFKVTNEEKLEYRALAE